MENGNTRAAKHFSEVLKININESSVRRMKAEYIQTLKGCASGQIKRLPKKTQGRPLMLGNKLDSAVQEYVWSMRAVGAWCHECEYCNGSC